jgi:hypothetical protein
MLTDEQVAEGLKRAREIQKREHRMSQDSEYREFCTCLPYPEATRRASVAEAERDEARQEAEWQQKRAIGAENRNDDLRLSCQEQSRAKCAAIERAEMAEAARQQARREAFEEAAKLRCYRCRQGVPVRLAPGGPSKLFWHDLPGGDVVVCESAAIRALSEVER